MNLRLKKMVDGGREQQSILAIQALVAGFAVAPGFAVAGYQVFESVHSRNSAALLDAADVALEDPLPSARHDQRFASNKSLAAWMVSAM
jgi:hypothetical protein